MPRGVPGPVKKSTPNNRGKGKRPDQIGGGKPGPGRPPGVPNKFNGELKEAILAGVNGAHELGVAGFVLALAMETPTSAAALLGRLIPVSMGGAVDLNLTVRYVDETE
jgi:hypothetical protein